MTYNGLHSTFLISELLLLVDNHCSMQ